MYENDENLLRMLEELKEPKKPTPDELLAKLKDQGYPAKQIDVAKVMIRLDQLITDNIDKLKSSSGWQVMGAEFDIESISPELQDAFSINISNMLNLDMNEEGHNAEAAQQAANYQALEQSVKPRAAFSIKLEIYDGALFHEQGFTYHLEGIFDIADFIKNVNTDLQSNFSIKLTANKLQVHAEKNSVLVEEMADLLDEQTKEQITISDKSTNFWNSKQQDTTVVSQVQPDL